MKAQHVNVILGILLAGAIVFGIHQSRALRQLRTANESEAASGAPQALNGTDGILLATSAEQDSNSNHNSDTAGDALSTKPAVSGSETTDGNTQAMVPAAGTRRRNRAAASPPDTAETQANAAASARKRSHQRTDEHSKNAQSIEKSNQLVNRALGLMREGDLLSAEELLQQSLEENISNQKAWLQMARLQRKLGLTDAEIGVYQQWMEARPGDGSPYYMLAETYTKLGQDAEARYYLSQFESLSGNNVDNYARTAQLYRQLQDRAEEGRLLSQWIAEAPDSTDAQRAWADYQRRLGGYDAALSQYALMASTMPNNPMPYQQMGDIYRRLGNYAQAQNQYETALSLRPGNIAVLDRLADTRYRTGDMQGALDAYMEIIDIEPGSRTAETAERRIAAIERQVQRAGGA